MGILCIGVYLGSDGLSFSPSNQILNETFQFLSSYSKHKKTRNEYFTNLNFAHLENEFEQCELFLQILDTMLTFGTLLDRLDWKAIHVFKQQASSSMGHAVCDGYWR